MPASQYGRKVMFSLPKILGIESKSKNGAFLKEIILKMVPGFLFTEPKNELHGQSR